MPEAGLASRITLSAARHSQVATNATGMIAKYLATSWPAA